MLIGKASAATTSISTADAASVTVRGRDLATDLMGRLTFTEYFHLLVTGREYSLTLSRPKLPAGKAIVQLYNYGEDTHDLNLQRNGSDRIYEIGDVEPGQTGAVELRLRRRSSYRLWCAIDPHASLGMVATLQTKAKRPRRHR